MVYTEQQKQIRKLKKSLEYQEISFIKYLNEYYHVIGYDRINIDHELDYIDELKDDVE